MLLHRYLGSHAFETLKEAKLKTSRITSFNDPFEFLFVMTGKITPKTAREYIESRWGDPHFLHLAAQHVPGLRTARDPLKLLKKHIPVLTANLVKKSKTIIQTPLKLREQSADKSTRVVCFSNAELKPLDEILLWSHYAKMHGGVRIGFEFPSDTRYPFRIFEVQYRERRFEIDYAKGLLPLTIGQALLESVKVKSLAWRYENEHRLLTHPDCCEKSTMPNSTQKCFLSFEPAWVKSVDFGVRCPQDEIGRIRDLLNVNYPHVLCRKADFHETEYALVYREI